MIFWNKVFISRATQSLASINSSLRYTRHNLSWMGCMCSLQPSQNLSTTSILMAEPLKKKKRIDPAVIRAREERKRKKLEKQIRRLEKYERQLKPLSELEIPTSIIDNYKERCRETPQLSYEEMESRWLLQKQWSKHKALESTQQVAMIDRLIASQNKALEELRAESEELYAAAIKVDYGYIPYEIKGPVETPPNKKYASEECAEGDFIDISKKWD